MTNRLLAFTGCPLGDFTIADAHVWWHAAIVRGELRQWRHHRDPHPEVIGLDCGQVEVLEAQFEAAVQRLREMGCECEDER